MLAVAVAALVPAGQSPGGLYRVQAGESLSIVAGRVYGDTAAWPAIMLASNRRLEEVPELRFIGDPNTVASGEAVWLPQPAEADVLNALYADYLRAVADMALPQPWEVVHDLVALSQEPARVVSWARDGVFSTGAQPAAGDIWVTVEPHLQEFCRRQARSLSAEELVLRLEQRLGLPPASNKTVFVRITVDGDGIFRPCADPRTDTVTCALGPPPDRVAPADQDWFYRQYYGSYALARPTQYPWTSLGYTYDWGGDGSEVGESEFVIRRGAAITVEAIVPTAQYCGGPR